MNDKIQGCPFCGGVVEIDDPEAYKRDCGYNVECEPCYVSMWAFKGEKPEQLIRRWNQRIAHDPEEASINLWRVIGRDGNTRVLLADDAARANWEAENPTRLRLWGWRVVAND